MAPTVSDPAQPALDIETLDLVDGRRAEVRLLNAQDAVTAIAQLGDPDAAGRPLRGGLAIVDENGEIVGVATMGAEERPATRARVMVRADWRRAGAGRLLLRRLAEEGAREGLEWLVGTFPSDDEASARLVAGSGLVVARRAVAGMTTTAIRLTALRSLSLSPVPRRADSLDGADAGITSPRRAANRAGTASAPLKTRAST